MRGRIWSKTRGAAYGKAENVAAGELLLLAVYFLLPLYPFSRL